VEVLTAHAIPAERIENNRFFSDTEYRALLESHGFLVEQVTLTPRPTALPSGMADWLRTFRSSVLEQVPAVERPAALEQIVGLLKPVLCDREGNWTADYMRLRFVARRA
jgi:hypothetical protein